MNINRIDNDLFEVDDGKEKRTMTLDEVMFLLSQPIIPKQEPSQLEIEEFWEDR